MQIKLILYIYSYCVSVFIFWLQYTDRSETQTVCCADWEKRKKNNINNKLYINANKRRSFYFSFFSSIKFNLICVNFLQGLMEFVQFFLSSSLSEQYLISCVLSTNLISLLCTINQLRNSSIEFLVWVMSKFSEKSQCFQT